MTRHEGPYPGSGTPLPRVVPWDLPRRCHSTRRGLGVRSSGVSGNPLHPDSVPVSALVSPEVEGLPMVLSSSVLPK